MWKKHTQNCTDENLFDDTHGIHPYCIVWKLNKSLTLINFFYFRFVSFSLCAACCRYNITIYLFVCRRRRRRYYFSQSGFLAHSLILSLSHTYTLSFILSRFHFYSFDTISDEHIFHRHFTLLFAGWCCFFAYFFSSSFLYYYINIFGSFYSSSITTIYYCLRYLRFNSQYVLSYDVMWCVWLYVQYEVIIKKNSNNNTAITITKWINKWNQCVLNSKMEWKFVSALRSVKYEEFIANSNSNNSNNSKKKMKMRKIIYGGLEWNRVTYESANGIKRMKKQEIEKHTEKQCQNLFL